jgi:hypothetical protein
MRQNGAAVNTTRTHRGVAVTTSADIRPARRRRSRLLVTALTMAFLAGLLTTGSPVDAASDRGAARDHYPDVSDGHPFHEEIAWMTDQGFMEGYADGSFRPDATVSRQAFVATLWRMSDEPAGPFGGEPFSDVAPGHGFYTQISWAYSMGIIGGYNDGTFRPTAPMSRQAFGAILHELSGIHRVYGPSFEMIDVPTTHLFFDAIRWWVASGQADGYDDGTFRPTEPVTRQAGAAFLSRFYDMMGGYWPFEDHHSHVCTEEPTEEQNEAADALLAAALVQVPLLFETKGEALAAGYRVTAPPFGGEGSHMVNDDYTQDGIALDPTKPESLVIGDDPGPEDNNSPVAAEMFVREYVGSGPTWPPEPGGCRTLWHGHDNLCYNGSLLEESSVVWLSTIGSGCIGNSMVRITPEMLHVWVDGRPDPFSGIET